MMFSPNLMRSFISRWILARQLDRISMDLLCLGQVPFSLILRSGENFQNGLKRLGRNHIEEQPSFFSYLREPTRNGFMITSLRRSSRDGARFDLFEDDSDSRIRIRQNGIRRAVPHFQV